MAVYYSNSQKKFIESNESAEILSEKGFDPLYLVGFQIQDFYWVYGLMTRINHNKFKDIFFNQEKIIDDELEYSESFCPIDNLNQLKIIICYIKNFDSNIYSSESYENLLLSKYKEFFKTVQTIFYEHGDNNTNKDIGIRSEIQNFINDDGSNLPNKPISLRIPLNSSILYFNIILELLKECYDLKFLNKYGTVLSNLINSIKNGNLLDLEFLNLTIPIADDNNIIFEMFDLKGVNDIDYNNLPSVLSSNLQNVEEKLTSLSNTLEEKIYQRIISVILPNELKEDFFQTINRLLISELNLEFSKKYGLISDKVNEHLEKFELDTKDTIEKNKTELENAKLQFAEYMKLMTKSKQECQDLIKKIDIIIQNLVDDVMKKVHEENPYKQITIKLPNGIEEKKIGLYHKCFNEVFYMVKEKMPVYLYGPAGCGKSVLAKQIAKLLGVKFHFMNSAFEMHELMGFVDAGGKYHETPFYNAIKEGGLLFIDEMDNSDASVLLKINSTIGTGNDFYIDFPNGEHINVNDNYYVIAAGNTIGNGYNNLYTGRKSLDMASLNRFTPEEMDYDTNIEIALISTENKEKDKYILPLFWEVRRIIRENNLGYVVSTRNIINADKLISSKLFSLESIFKKYLGGDFLKEEDFEIIYKEFDRELVQKNVFCSEYFSYLQRLVDPNHTFEELNKGKQYSLY